MTENMTATETGVVTKLSPLTVADTTAKLTGMIATNGMKLFAVIDQAAEARQAGLTLRETILVIFGSPAAGTPVMAASPLSALDLPLKVLVWSDEGQTKVSVLRAGRAGGPPPPQPGAGGQPGRDQRADRRPGGRPAARRNVTTP